MPGTSALGEEKILIFILAGRQFAVEIGGVEQILEYQPPIPTPRRPSYVEGILEHRGHYVPVMSLGKRLGVAEAASLLSAIVLLRGIGSDPLVGLIVDQVVRILPVSLEGILAPPPRVFGIRAEFVRGVVNVGGRPVVWLDAAKLLTSPEPISLLA